MKGSKPKQACEDDQAFNQHQHGDDPKDGAISLDNPFVRAVSHEGLDLDSRDEGAFACVRGEAHHKAIAGVIDAALHWIWQRLRDCSHPA